MRSTSIEPQHWHVDDMHRQAILLWIAAKERDPHCNPAHSIYFALTNDIWPRDVPEVNNAIDLCGALNLFMGQPPLTAEAKSALRATAVSLFDEHESGRGPLNAHRRLAWIQRFAYLLGFIALMSRGMSWLVACMIFATWSCYGAARGAANMARYSERPEWEMPVLAGMHVMALIGLVVASLFHLIVV